MALHSPINNFEMITIINVCRKRCMHLKKNQWTGLKLCASKRLLEQTCLVYQWISFSMSCILWQNKFSIPFLKNDHHNHNMHGRAPSSFYSESAKNIAPRQNSIKWFLPSFCWKKRIQLPYKWQMVVLYQRKIYNRYQILLRQVICKTYSEVTRVCSLYVTNTKLNMAVNF